MQMNVPDTNKSLATMCLHPFVQTTCYLKPNRFTASPYSWFV